MQNFRFSSENKLTILALGAESAGNFSVYNKGKIYFSEDFGDLLENTNFNEYRHKLHEFIRKNKIKPDVILTDLHPLYRTTLLGHKLAKKYKAQHIQVQHHLAHIFSAIGTTNITTSAIGIALDGTGYGLDDNIWGGEIFKISNFSKAKLSRPPKLNFRKISRIGHLENQTMIGGDLAVKEPARILIAILSNFLTKDNVYKHVKKFYTRNQFELLYNQLQSGFNCQETSSAGRILDAVSILLGFCQNERKFKHAPVILLEKNSTQPYADLKPKLVKTKLTYELNTTYLFKYLFKYPSRDKERLAATAQLYIAQGLYEIVKKSSVISHQSSKIFLAGGIANNKIISEYLIFKDAIVNTNISRGDAGISFGQIIYYLANPRD